MPVAQQDKSKENQPQYEVSDDDKARVLKIADAWKAYEGDLPPPLKKMDGQPDDNVMTNRCQAIVDRGIDFLFGKELEISLSENAPEDAQKFLDDTWGRKETRIPLLQKLAMNGALAGQAFLRIVPAPDGQSFRLVVVDPATVYIKTAPGDCDTVMLYCIEYLVASEKTYYREEISRLDPENDDPDSANQMVDQDTTWTINHWTRQGERGTWVPAGEPIEWPYPFPPVFSCQNLPKPNDPWGYPDIRPDIIGLNNALNFVESNINRNGKFYGQPILYATGVGDSVIQFKPGLIIGLPSPDSKIVAVPLPGDMANQLSFAADLRSDIDEQSGVPGVATGRLSTAPNGNISGIALELLFMPIIKKTDKKRCSYGELIIDVSMALLMLKGINTEEITITLNWQNPLPHDDLKDIQAAQLKKQIGVSDQTLLEELGYNPDEEMERNQAEDSVKMANFLQGRGAPPPLPPDQQEQDQTTQQPEPVPVGGKA